MKLQVGCFVVCIAIFMVGCGGGASYTSYEQYVRARAEQLEQGAQPTPGQNKMVGELKCQEVSWAIPPHNVWSADHSSFTVDPGKAIITDTLCLQSDGSFRMQ